MKNWLMSLILLTFSGLATAEDFDPFEDINRAVYEFNEVVDGSFLEPISRAYKKSTPILVQDSVRNFFGNLDDVTTLANQILQVKPLESITTLGRIFINTTFGIGGIFDVASGLGFTTDTEDFGQTMAVWGLDAGPYIMLPLIGPSTLRDTLGVYIDVRSDSNMINKLDNFEFVTVNTMNTVDKRVKLLPVTDLFHKSNDSYISMRSAYLQKREYDVYDGNLPFSDDDF
jgi:phospholipid-binding lipoprotein MlaA